MERVLFCIAALGGVEATLASGEKPNVVHIMADDLGRDNLGHFNGGKTRTPNLDHFFEEGIFLSSFHTFKICGPSRASTMTGRYPFNVGFYGDGKAQHISNFTTTAQVLQQEGYATHAIGKWDVGYVVKETTATYKGFDTFLGYYKACNDDLFYHSVGSGNCGPQTFSQDTDMSKNYGDTIGPALGLNGTYSTRIFSEEAVRHIKAHNASSGPLYLYVAPQNVHVACGDKPSKLTQGIQAPCETADTFPLVKNDTYKGQSAVTQELDMLVGNITAALKTANMWENTAIIFTSDNGGPLDHTTNYPLRGGKHTFWDGGVRVVAALGGGLVPPDRRGKTWPGLAHSADWFRTVAEGLAGAAIAKNATGPIDDDSFDLWGAVLGGRASPRNEVVHQVVSPYFTEKVSAIRVGDMKLIVGAPGDARTLKWPDLLPEGSVPVPFGASGGLRRDGNTSCLSGIVADGRW